MNLKTIAVFFYVSSMGTLPLSSADDGAHMLRQEVRAMLERKEAVRQELLSIQATLARVNDQLNREKERFSTGLGILPPAPQPKIIPPAPPEIKEAEPAENPSKTEEFERERQALEAKLDEIIRANQRPSPAMKPAPPPVPTPPSISGPVPVRQSFGGPGGYFVSSLALVYSSGFDWTSIVVGSSFEVEESLGGGASLRTGWAWDNYFADIHFTYARSDLKSIDLQSIYSGRFNPSFSGDTEFFGFHLTGGRKLDLLDDLKLPIGFGVGGGRQEISMMIGGVPYSENDVVLTYHLFAGLEYFATEHLLFGMHYRLVNLGELTSFSSRALQMLEFSCGYQY
tara:strand:+ start:323 stop:1342 length:1020 start_codon:yes stop_codon:yes gene_type:complete